MLASHSDQSGVNQSATVEADNAAAVGVQSNRWVLLFAIWVSFSISIIDRMAWANVSTSYAKSFALPVAALGSFFSAFYVGYFVTNAVSGFAADWFGGRRMVTLALLALGALTFAFGFSTSITVGLIIQAAMGFVAGMDYSACVKLLSGAFPASKKATAMGLFLTSVPVGLTLPNLFIPTLLQTYGWQGVYRTLGVVTIAIGVGAYCIIRDNGSSASASPKATRPPFRELARNRGLLVSAFGGFGALWGAWGFAFWSNALLIKGHHIPPVQAGFIIALFGGSGIVSKPFSGWLADHVSVSKTTLSIFWCLAFAASLVVFAYLETPTAFMITCAVVGFSAWAGAVLIATLVLESVSPALSGSSSGLANALWMLGNVVVPMVVGAVFQLTQSFHMAIFALAAGPLLGAFVLLFMPKPELRSSP